MNYIYQYLELWSIAPTSFVVATLTIALFLICVIAIIFDTLAECFVDFCTRGENTYLGVLRIICSWHLRLMFYVEECEYEGTEFKRYKIRQRIWGSYHDQFAGQAYEKDMTFRYSLADIENRRECAVRDNKEAVLGDMFGHLVLLLFFCTMFDAAFMFIPVITMWVISVLGVTIGAAHLCRFVFDLKKDVETIKSSKNDNS